ncbi:MAG: hypothetical protein QM648_05605 [Solirubrobacterales bacterium]
MKLAVALTSALVLAFSATASADEPLSCASIGLTGIIGEDTQLDFNLDDTEGDGSNNAVCAGRTLGTPSLADEERVDPFDLPYAYQPPTGWGLSHTAREVGFNALGATPGRATWHVPAALPEDEPDEVQTFDVRVTIKSKTDLAIQSITHSGTGEVGGTGTYHVTAINNGSAPAHGVRFLIESTIPSEVGSATPAGCDSNPLETFWTLVCNSDTPLNPGQTRTVDVQMTNYSTRCLLLANVSSWIVSDPDNGNNTDQLALSTTSLPETCLTGSSGGNSGSGNSGGSGSPVPGTVAPKLSKPAHIKVKSGNVSFSTTASFAVPSGFTTAQACAGKLKAEIKPSGAKKASTDSAALKPKGSTCITPLEFKLAKKYKGKKVPVKLKFAGDSAVQAFTTTISLKLK